MDLQREATRPGARKEMAKLEVVPCLDNVVSCALVGEWCRDRCLSRQELRGCYSTYSESKPRWCRVVTHDNVAFGWLGPVVNCDGNALCSKFSECIGRLCYVAWGNHPGG